MTETLAASSTKAIDRAIAPVLETLAASSTVGDIERLRKAKQISTAELLRRSKVSASTWWEIRAGKRKPQETTLRRLQAALGGVYLLPTPTPMVLGFHIMAVTVLAQESGEDPDVMLAQDFSAERPRDPIWLKAAAFRRQAMYLTAVEMQVSNAVIGRAIGCSRQNVHQARNAIEDAREFNPVLDAVLDRCGARLARRRP